MIPTQVYYRSFVLIGAFVLSILPVIAKPIYTVVGTVKQADGKLAPDGLKVVVTNTARQLTAETVLGLQQRGKFAVIFTNFDGQSVVSISDQVSIWVNNQSGKTVVEQTYQVSDTEFRAGRSIRDLQIEPVKITAVGVKLAEGQKPTTVKAGEGLIFEMTGSADQSASLTVDGIKALTDLPLKEVTAGKYQANYTVQPGDNSTDGILNFKLSNQTNSSQQLTVDTTPPAKPTNLQVSGGKITLTNYKAVTITALADPSSSVTISLLDTEGNQQTDSVQTDTSGGLKGVLDTSHLLNGRLTLSAQQAPDLAGNPGLVAEITVFKDTPIPTFSIEVSPASVNIQVGQTGQSTILISGQNSFDQKVKLSADRSTLPVGAEVSFEPSQITVTNSTQTVTMTTDTSQVKTAGSYTVGLIAQSPDLTKTVSLELIIEKLGAFITLNPPGSTSYQQEFALAGQVVLMDEPPDQRTQLTIQLQLQAPDQTVQTEQVLTDTDRTYTFTSLKLEQIGLWPATVSWPGDDKYDPISQSKPIQVDKAQLPLSLDE